LTLSVEGIVILWNGKMIAAYFSEMRCYHLEFLAAEKGAKTGRFQGRLSRYRELVRGLYLIVWNRGKARNLAVFRGAFMRAGNSP